MALVASAPTERGEGRGNTVAAARLKLVTGCFRYLVTGRVLFFSVSYCDLVDY